MKIQEQIISVENGFSYLSISFEVQNFKQISFEDYWNIQELIENYLKDNCNED
jgi:hypothetical protein